MQSGKAFDGNWLHLPMSIRTYDGRFPSVSFLHYLVMILVEVYILNWHILQEQYSDRLKLPWAVLKYIGKLVRSIAGWQLLKQYFIRSTRNLHSRFLLISFDHFCFWLICCACIILEYNMHDIDTVWYGILSGVDVDRAVTRQYTEYEVTLEYTQGILLRRRKPNEFHERLNVCRGQYLHA